jgi:hypothetical protein
MVDIAMVDNLGPRSLAVILFRCILFNFNEMMLHGRLWCYTAMLKTQNSQTFFCAPVLPRVAATQIMV